MADQTLDEFYSGVLNDEIQAIPRLSDVPGLVLRRYPPEVSDPTHQKYPEWRTWQALFMNLAKSNPWAREGLRKYILDLRADGEDVPPVLGEWAIDQFAQGEPAPHRGRPEESDRDFRVSTFYTMLWRSGYTRAAAVEQIANWMVCEPETVRSITRKFRNTRAFR